MLKEGGDNEITRNPWLEARRILWTLVGARRPRGACDACMRFPQSCCREPSCMCTRNLDTWQ